MLSASLCSLWGVLGFNGAVYEVTGGGATVFWEDREGVTMKGCFSSLRASEISDSQRRRKAKFLAGTWGSRSLTEGPWKEGEPQKSRNYNKIGQEESPALQMFSMKGVHAQRAGGHTHLLSTRHVHLGPPCWVHLHPLALPLEEGPCTPWGL